MGKVQDTATALRVDWLTGQEKRELVCGLFRELQICTVEDDQGSEVETCMPHCPRKGEQDVENQDEETPYDRLTLRQQKELRCRLFRAIGICKLPVVEDVEACSRDGGCPKRK